MRRTAFALALLAALPASAALAVPATPEEAQRLAALLADYVGHGVNGGPAPVKVVPHGDSYTATLDITRLFAFTSAAGFDVTAGDLVAELTPQPDGLWHVLVDGFPPVGITHEKQSSAVAIKGYRLDGTFDPRLQAFAQSTSANTGLETHVRGPKGDADVAYTVKGAGSSKAAAAGDGLVTQSTVLDDKDVDYRITTPPAAGAQAPAAETAHVTIATVAGNTTVEQVPTVALNDLWRFLVAHPSKQTLVADQPALKTKLKAVLPLASAMTGELDLSKLAVDTSLGRVALDSVREAYGAAGPTENAFSLHVAGLSLPENLVPRWIAPLVPTSLDLSQNYGPVNLTAALRLAVDLMDLSADKPLTYDQQMAVLKALGSESMMVKIAPSRIVTPTLKVLFQGATRSATPPSGSATISATGLDKTIAAIQAAASGEPMGANVVVLLLAAKGLAKAEGPDSYSWQVELAPDGTVSVNGTSLSHLAPKPPDGTDGGGKPRRT